MYNEVQILHYLCKYTHMLNKNTWDVKKCEAIQKQHCQQAGTTKRFDIKKLLYQKYLTP